MPFGLKNAPSEFQNIINEIFNPFSKLCIVYVDDVLIFSKSIDEHWTHLNLFLSIIKYNGLVVSSPKIKLFQTKIRFLGYNIYQAKISPIDRVIKFADKFPDEILDKTQLQRFLGSLNMLRNSIKLLGNSVSLFLIDFRVTFLHGQLFTLSLSRILKKYVKTLPCLGIPTINSFKIVETDASNIGYGGILKQKINPDSPEQIVRFHSGV